MRWLTNWFLRAVTCSGIFLFPAFLNAQQTFTLEQAYQASEAYYPLMKQKALISEASALTAKNIETALLPQVVINGQASYQSDVTKVAISIPGVKITELSKDQYKLTADVSQAIYEGGLVNSQKNIQLLSQQVEESKLEVDLYSLKTRVSQLFLNIIFQDALLRQSTLVSRDIEIGVQKVRPQVEQGVILRS